MLLLLSKEKKISCKCGWKEYTFGVTLKNKTKQIILGFKTAKTQENITEGLLLSPKIQDRSKKQQQQHINKNIFCPFVFVCICIGEETTK